MKIQFSVSGTPRPKQSVKRTVSKKTGEPIYYTPALMKEWQNTVSWKAKEVMAGKPPLDCKLIVMLEFCLPDHKPKDADNLSKGVLDGCNKIIWQDDKQIILLILEKSVIDDCDEVGVTISITDALDSARVVDMLKETLFKGD